MKRTIIILTIPVVFIVMSIFLSKMYLNNFLNKKIHEDSFIVIGKGSGLNQLANTLEKQGIINNKLLFKLVVKAKTKNKSNIKYGEYKFDANMTTREIIDNIINNRVFYRTITFAEGLSNHSILKIIENNEFLTGEIPKYNIPEGSLLPQTYKFQRGDTREDLIVRMAKSMFTTVDKYWSGRAKNLPFKTRKEALILASVVEKETGLERERGLVASVFINRLRINMPLQSDPTAIYGYAFGDVSKEKDIKTHILIRQDSPYNTYKIKGLPPEPICNPGEESIKAVLNPPETKYLFFVATGNGGHNFSENYFEHRKMVKSFKKAVRDAKTQQK